MSIYEQYYSLSEFERQQLASNNYWRSYNGLPLIPVPTTDTNYWNYFKYYTPDDVVTMKPYKYEYSKFPITKNNLKQLITKMAKTKPEAPQIVEEVRKTYAKSLYTILLERMNIEEELILSEGEVTEELDALMFSNKEDAEEKIMAIKKVLDKANQQMDWAKAQMERFKKYSKERERLADAMEEKISIALNLFGTEDAKGVKKWEIQNETDFIKLSFRKSESVQIVDENLIPADFWAVKIPEATVDKTAIKEAIKGGLEVPGAEIKVSQNIQIK
jgi:hypothetical protein